jgi:hypothetical protein
MEKIVHEVIIKPSKHVEISYKAIDGSLFNSEEACIDYENKLAYIEKFAKIQTVYFDGDNIQCNRWYKCKDQKELNIVFKHYSNAYRYGFENTVEDEWFCVIYNDGGDHRDSAKIITLKEVTEEYNNLLRFLENNK